MNSDLYLFEMLKGGVDKQTRDAMGTSIVKTLCQYLNAPPPAPLSEPDSQAVADLRRLGFATIPPIFSVDELDDIDRYLADKTISFSSFELGTKDIVRGRFADHPQNVRFGQWDQEVVSGCPAFARAAHDPRLLQIAETYLGAPPTISILTAWWSFPSNAAAGGMQYFHHDRDDFRCLKLFVYLTDTPLDAGPHQFVDETHSFKTLLNFVNRRTWENKAEKIEFLRWMEEHRKKEVDVHAYFPPENIRVVSGDRGTTFLEDTRGLHRGIPPVSRPRLAFEICYSLMPKHNEVYKPTQRPSAVREPAKSVKYTTRCFYEGSSSESPQAVGTKSVREQQVPKREPKSGQKTVAPKREQQGIITKYELLWGNVRDWARANADRGAMLPEVLHGAFLMANNVAPSGTCSPQLARSADLFVDNAAVRVSPITLEYMWRGMTADAVMQSMRPDTDVIIELGAGWSANLFSLYLRGAPHAARYFGCELTAGGREAGEAIAASEARLDYRAIPFDWSKPAYAFVPSDARHVTVFSCYSIEQIPYLGTEVFTRLLEATAGAESVSGVHIEPLGFQYPELVHSPAAIELQKNYAIEKDYNLNAREIFERLAKSGTLRVSPPEVDVFAYSPKNPATIVRWERP